MRYKRVHLQLIKRKFIPLVFVFLLGGVNTAMGQEDDEPVKEEAPRPVNQREVIPAFRPALRGAFKLPNTTANTFYKKIFNGVSNVEVGYTYPFLKNFFAGVGIQHSYYDINKFSFTEVTHGKLLSYLGYGEIGFQKYTTEKWYYMLSLRAGYSNVTVKCDNCDAEGVVPSQNVLFNEAQFGFYLHGNERMSYGLLLSYQLYHYEFNPSWLCKTSIGGLTDKDYRGISQTLTIGFGFTCILGKMPE